MNIFIIKYSKFNTFKNKNSILIIAPFGILYSVNILFWDFRCFESIQFGIFCFEKYLVWQQFNLKYFSFRNIQLEIIYLGSIFNLEYWEYFILEIFYLGFFCSKRIQFGIFAFENIQLGIFFVWIIQFRILHHLKYILLEIFYLWYFVLEIFQFGIFHFERIQFWIQKLLF